MLFAIAATICIFLFARSGRAQGRAEDALAIPVVCLCIAIIFLILLVLAIRRLRWRLYIHQDGFVLDKTSSRTVVPWDQIKYIRVASTDIAGIEMRIEMESRQTVKFDPIFRDYASLVRSIQQSANSYLREQANAKLRRDLPIEFGKLKVFATGLDNGNERIFWGDVDRITFVDAGKCLKMIIRKVGQEMGLV